ncbi:MAG: hypothetical protein JWQ08_776 [Deinococcus sp.]|nr:hypothetical protein [Deinococcus sp.]
MNIISAKGDPIHIKVDWRATQPITKNTVDVQWESRPVGGNFLVVRLKAQTTDPDINPRKVEDALVREFLNMRGVRLVASGR